MTLHIEERTKLMDIYDGLRRKSSPKRRLVPSSRLTNGLAMMMMVRTYTMLTRLAHDLCIMR